MNPKRLIIGLRGDQTTLKISYEPCCEKTGLRGFRPGQTQNGLYSYRSWLVAELEISDLGSRGIVLAV